MKTSQLFAIQSSIFLVGSTAADGMIAKIGFFIVAILYMVSSIGAARDGN
jgi:MFS-type transporter involved in bile tolerance (Atg22 family)